MAQVEDWISDLETYSSDKRVGRSIAHSCTSLKVCHRPVSFTIVFNFLRFFSLFYFWAVCLHRSDVVLLIICWSLKCVVVLTRFLA